MLQLLVLACTAALALDTTPTSPTEIPLGMGRPSADDEGLPSFEKVGEGYTAVVSSVDGKGGLYTLYRDDDDNLLIELPAGFDGQPILIAYTVSSGVSVAGVQLGDMYGFWTRIHDQLVLVAPNLETRTTGDSQSQQGYEIWKSLIWLVLLLVLLETWLTRAISHKTAGESV